jgi:hypothetical protein
MKEVRDQTLQSFRTINRKFKDQFINQSLIHFICQEGYYEMLEFIIDPKNHSVFEDEVLNINPKDLKGRIPLFMCFTPPTATFLGVRYGVTEAGQAIPSRPAGILNANDWIKPGGQQQRENCVRLLIEQGASVNEPDYHLFCPIHYAAMWGWEVTGRRLLQAGADLNAANVNGRTPLMFAVEYGHKYFVEFLVSKLPALRLDATDAAGNTALILAVLSGSPGMAILRVLLEAKADTEVSNSKKKTALHVACEAQSVEQVNLLFDFKVERTEACLNLLEGGAARAIMTRIDDEERQAVLDLERQQKEAVLRARDGMVDLRHDDPTGRWVLLNDKRGTGQFYYNTVSRASQRKVPIDYAPDPLRPVRDVTYGMHFYHF